MSFLSHQIWYKEQNFNDVTVPGGAFQHTSYLQNEV